MQQSTTELPPIYHYSRGKIAQIEEVLVLLSLPDAETGTEPKIQDIKDKLQETQKKLHMALKDYAMSKASTVIKATPGVKSI